MVVDSIVRFFSEMVFLFIEMVPYITLGVLIAGVLHVFLREDFVSRHIGGNTVSSVFKAALFGVPLPLCSCGVVPTAVYLKNSGASKSSVLSFLVSTPQTGVDSIAATWGMLGPLFAIFKAAAALVMGTLGGIADFLFEKTGRPDSWKDEMDTGKPAVTPETLTNKGIIGKLRKIFDYAFFELLDDIAVQFLIGLAIAAAITLLIPEDFFAGSVIGNPLISMVLMVLIGIPMYICSTSSIPIAVAMIAKGLSPGAAYVFLVAGPATNAASLAIITRMLGKKTTVRYLVTIITGSMIFGFLMDFIYTGLGLQPFSSTEALLPGENPFTIFEIGVSIFFLLMLIIVLIRKVRLRTSARSIGEDEEFQMKVDSLTRIGIEGMDCSHCSASVERALRTVTGMKTVDVSLEGGCAFIDGDVDIAEAEEAVRKAGYVVSGSSRAGRD